MPAGESVRYLPVFDKIKQARINEDESLSQGVWESPLVKADWAAVSELCQQVLSEQSKDLQIAVWLADAWSQQYGLEGMASGVRFVTALSSAFWDSFHPDNDSKSEESSHEARLMIYEWYRKSLIQHLHGYSLLKSHRGQPINLLALQNAERLHDAISRSKNPDKLREKAKSRNELFKSDIDNYIKLIPQSELSDKVESMRQLNKATKELSKLLDEKVQNNTLSFSQVYTTIDSLSRLLTGVNLSEIDVKNDSPQPVETMEEESASKTPHQNKQECNSRAAAYASIKQALHYLESIEPHSPTPHVLKKVLQWENQSLAEIFAGFGSNPQDFVTIANFIGLTVKNDNAMPVPPAMPGKK